MADLQGKGLQDKFAIAAELKRIAALLALKGGQNRFKARAYEAAARTIMSISSDPGTLLEEGRLTSLKGIGEAISSQIEQLYRTGSSSVLESLLRQFPRGTLELSRLPGLNVDKAKLLITTLGISSVAELGAACASGKLQNIKGFGAKTEQKLLMAIDSAESRQQNPRRLHVHHALRVAEEILTYLRTSPNLESVSIAGSLRRAKETVGTVRLVAASSRPSGLIKHFKRFPLIVSMQESPDQVICTLTDETPVSLTVVKPNQFPSALLWETGSPEHTARLQEIATQKHLKLHPFGLSPDSVRRRVRPQSVLETEEAIYQRLGLQAVPAELRENVGEIEAAADHKLPKDLVSVSDIQGMIHCHTTYSDGKHTIEQMALSAEALGMKYLTITDHSPTASYAGGLTLDRLHRQWDEIDRVQENVKIKILKGTESDIVASGSLDYPDNILEQFDVVIASIHSRYKMGRQEMTRRLITAMRQPIFKIWGHALGRLIERRPPFDCDVDRVLDTIAESKAAVEINGDPYRLDMEPRWIREARKREIKFVISVDAHSTGAMNNLKFGVGIARRGWVSRREVLNTLNAAAFRKAVHP